MYKVYVKTNSQTRITAINSDAFIPDHTDWIEVDEGDGDKYHHAQNNYLEKPLMTMQGVYQYKLVDGKIVERTAAEMQVDIDAIPTPPPTVEARVTTIEDVVIAISEVLAYE